jgi:hypothetical protein
MRLVVQVPHMGILNAYKILFSKPADKDTNHFEGISVDEE